MPDLRVLLDSQVRYLQPLSLICLWNSVKPISGLTSFEKRDVSEDEDTGMGRSFPRPLLPPPLTWVVATLAPEQCPHLCVSSRNEDLISRCGDDARIYIMFQYHLIIFILILCIPSLGIILPINYTGDVLGMWSSVDPEPSLLDLRGNPAGGTELGAWASQTLTSSCTSQD